MNYQIAILPPRAPGREVTIGGYAVPGIEVGEDKATGQWHVMLDNRFGIIADSLEELDRWMWIVANAMAIGAGYSSHGENSQLINPYKLKVTELTNG